MTCPTLARLQRKEQEFCDAALKYPQDTECVEYYRSRAKKTAIVQAIHKSDCPLCRDAVAQEGR